MMKFLYVFMMLAIFLTEGFSAESYTLKADKVVRVDNLTYFATGNVEVKTMDMTITADNLTYHQDSRKVVASGNVKLISPTQELTASELTYYIADAIGKVSNATGFIAPYHFICAEKLDKTGATTFTVENARISTCSGAIPDWSISMYSGEFEVEGYLTANHATADILNTPLIYLPKMVYPITSKRQSGFLIPDAGVSTYLGGFLSLYYFIAPDVDYDFTVGINLFSKAGAMPIFEARYSNSADNNFYAYGEWIHDFNSRSGTVERYKYLFKNDYKVFDNLKLSFNANDTSDYLYSRDYYKYSMSEYYKNNKDNIFFLDLRASFLSDYIDIQLAYRNNYLFRDRAVGYAKNRIELMPSLHMQKIIPIAEHLIVDYTAEYDYVYQSNNNYGLNNKVESSDSIKYNRINIGSSVYTPFDFTYLILTPKLTLGYTFWSANSNLPVKDYYSSIFGAVSKINDKMVGRYFGSAELITAFRDLFRQYRYFSHTISNTLTFQYTPNIRQDGLPQLFDTDFITPQGGASYKFANYFTGKQWFHSITLTQGYNMLAGDQVTPLTINMVTRVAGIITNTFDMIYKHTGTIAARDSRMQYVADELRLDITKYFFITTSYAHDTRVYDTYNTSVRVGGGLNIWQFQVTGYNKWQGLNNDGFSKLVNVAQGGSIMFNSECWSLGFQMDRLMYYNNYASGKSYLDEFVFYFLFSLRGLGNSKFQFTNRQDRPTS